MALVVSCHPATARFWSMIERLKEIFTVEPVLFLYMTSTFILTPASQQLVIAKVCRELYANASVCVDPRELAMYAEIQRRSSYVLLAYAGTLSLVSIPPAVLLGSRSDRMGRELGLLLPSLLSLLAGGVLIAMALVEDASPYWIVASALVTGASGGYVTVFLSCFSYVADVSDAGTRTLRMAVAESMVFLGGTVGFLLGGFLLQRSGFLAAFGAYSVCHALSVLYVLLWLRGPAPDTPSGGALPLLGYARLCLQAVARKRPDQGRLKLHFLILCTFLNNVIAVGEQFVLLLFLTYKPREFSTAMYGAFNSTRMLLLGVFLMGIFPLLLRCFGEMTLAKVSAGSRGVSYLLLAFSTNTWMVFLVAVVGAPAGITQAVTRSLSSAIVEPSEQGAMFSFMASMEALCVLVAAVIFNGIYPLTLTTFPGMVFVMMAGFAFIILIFMQWIGEMPRTHPCLLIQD